MTAARGRALGRNRRHTARQRDRAHVALGDEHDLDQLQVLALRV